MMSGLVVLCEPAAAEGPAALPTVNVTADFAAAAPVGAWLEAHVDIQRVGERLAFSNAYLMVDGARIARVSAVFARSRGALPGTA